MKLPMADIWCQHSVPLDVHITMQKINKRAITRVNLFLIVWIKKKKNKDNIVYLKLKDQEYCQTSSTILFANSDRI